MWLARVGNPPTLGKKKALKRFFDFLVWLFVCAKLTGVGLSVCEHAEKTKSYPGRWVLSHLRK